MTDPRAGINILTASQSIIIDGAEELLEQFSKGEISREELSSKLLDLEVVFVDRSSTNGFKGDEEPIA